MMVFKMALAAAAAQFALLVVPGGALAQDTAAPVVGGCAAAAVVPVDNAMRPAATEAVRCLINGERARRGLRAVTASSLLSRAATFHSADMVHRHYFAHVSPNGQNQRSRVTRAGYRGFGRSALVAEALGFGTDMFATPQELVADLMRSGVHRAIILDKRYRDVGVGLSLGAPIEGLEAAGESAVTLSVSFGRR
jgi:uncharacterized protein YkwD